MGSSLQSRPDGRRSYNAFRLRLGRKHRNTNILMCGCGTDRQPPNTRKQKILARSSSEAEFDAAALGASEPKGIASMMCDLGFVVKLVLAIDAKGTDPIRHRDRLHETCLCGTLVVAVRRVRTWAQKHSVGQQSRGMQNPSDTSACCGVTEKKGRTRGLQSSQQECREEAARHSLLSAGE